MNSNGDSISSTIHPSCPFSVSIRIQPVSDVFFYTVIDQPYDRSFRRPSSQCAPHLAMGWFWATPTPAPSAALLPPPHHPPVASSALPPPECAMHQGSAASRSSPPSSAVSPCPVRSPNHPLCKLSQKSTPSTALANPSEAPPISQSSTLSRYNPLNLIPTGLTNTPQENQSQVLPLTREESSIPRPDTGSNWEYPSPQQMYNAMLRKGYTDTDITAVESMVAVHNFLNEGAWAEIKEWESIFSPGLAHAWSICRRGEQGIAQDRARREFAQERRRIMGLDGSSSKKSPDGAPCDKAAATEPKLLRFQGLPQTPSPKARMLTTLGTVLPNHFSSEPPFDRHDWYVERTQSDGSKKQVRYVIDYYSGGEEAGGEQVFFLDIRPALDTPTAAAERAMRWSGDLWWRASGGEAREKSRNK
ncbi:hypothetical protein DV736_g4480, partial [Chaetothyriales sp. CBS 134916]